MIWENGIVTCILSCKNGIAGLCLMQDTACLGLVHGDDPERCYGEEGGRGVYVWDSLMMLYTVALYLFIFLTVEYAFEFSRLVITFLPRSKRLLIS